MTIGERIKVLRKEKNLSMEDFGSVIGMGKSAVSRIENGVNGTTDQTIRSICREFGVSEHWLRTGEGEMFEELTDQQKILKYTALLLKDKDSAVADAIQTLIVTYEQLDDTSKAVLEKIAKQYICLLYTSPSPRD